MSYFFHFSDLRNLVKCVDSMVPCYSLLNMNAIWLYMVHSFCSPSHYSGGGGGGGECRGDLIWRFAKILWWQNCFIHLGQDKPLWADLKANWGVICITMLLQFHLISLETAITQKSEAFLLISSLGNVNASVVTWWYPQIYNFSFRKEFLETLLGYLSRILTTISKTSFVKKSPTESPVSSL